MGCSDVRDWFTVYDRERRARKKGRDDLAWLGLVAQDDDENRSELGAFDRSAGSVPASRTELAGLAGS